MFVSLHKNTLFQKVLPYLSMQQYATITFLFYSPTHNDSDIFFVCSRLYQLVRKVLTILLPHIIPATASHVFPFFHHILQFFQTFFLCIKWYIHRFHFFQISHFSIFFYFKILCYTAWTHISYYITFSINRLLSF